MLAGNPYQRVLPGASLYKPSKKPSHLSSSLSSKNGKNQIGESPMKIAEPLEYISGEDVMAIYKEEVLALCISQEKQHTYVQNCRQELL